MAQRTAAADTLNSSTQAYWFGNPDYQRFLAENLVRSLGYDDALRACRANHWDTILDILRTEEFATRYH